MMNEYLVTLKDGTVATKDGRFTGEMALEVARDRAARAVLRKRREDAVKRLAARKGF